MDTFFNREAASAAYEMVMKLDDDTARAFVEQVTHAVLIQDIEANRRTINSRVTQVHKAIMEDAMKAVSKSTSVSAISVAEVISKAFGSDEFTRDKGGRFATVESRVRTDKTKRALPKGTAKRPGRSERGMGIPSAKGLASQSGSRGRKLTGAERAAYQQQYLQLADAMDTMATSGGKNLRMVLEDKTTGRRSEAGVNNLGRIQGWNPSRQNLVATRYDRPGSGAGNASFDVVSALGAPAAGRAAQGAVEGVERGGSAFADRWTNASGDTQGTNDRTYRRIQAGSELLGQVTPTGSKAHTAAKFGEFVGQYGPEAEKVVGPQMRKTAYRYRGTERTPDKELIASRNQQVLAMPDEGRTPEAKQMASVRASVGYLMNRLPNLRLSEIQRKSGRIPPSEGVIVNSKGEIAVQAVGHADDHYLPFNLKNTKALQGGEYVRTRSKGGLTTEDIYTGLVSGARQVTVVSNSGIFTINFEDDFRGARRYNDKAATMVDRYAKTLDAIKGGQIEREPISPQVKAELFDEVERDMPTGVFTAAERSAALKAKVENYKENPQLTTKEVEALDAQAQDAAGGDERKYRAFRAELNDRAMEAKRSRFYQLDGEGYSAALEALKEQYPYYIKSVTFMNRKEALNAAGERTDPGSYTEGARFKGGADEGYVAPRYNRPEGALEGYYDRNIAGSGNVAGTGKTEASYTGYQNWEHNPVRGNRGTAPSSSEETSTPTTPPVVGSGAAQQRGQTDLLAQAEKEVKIETATKKSVREMTSYAAGSHTLGDAFPVLTAARDDFDKTWADPAKRAALKTELESVQRDLNTWTGQNGENTKEQGRRLGEMLSAHGLIASSLGGKSFDRAESLGQRSATPFSFDGPGYASNATQGQYESELTRVGAMLRGSRLGDVSRADDGQLADAAAAMGVLSAMAGSNPQDAAREIIRVKESLGQDETWARAALQDIQSPEAGKRYAEAAEGLERLRALKSNQINRGAAPTSGRPLRDPDPVAARQAQLPQQSSAPAATSLLDGDEDSVRMAGTMLYTMEQALRRDDDYIQADDFKEIRTKIQRGDFQGAKSLAQSVAPDGQMDRAAMRSIFGSDPAWD